MPRKPSASSEPTPAAAPAAGPLLNTALATVFCSSAGIMMLQLVAGRLTATYLGQSLYTWTSAIAVTLAGIALGNALGGRLADRAAGRLGRQLGLQLLLAAGCVLAVLALNPLAGALPPLIALPWPARVFLHMALVFMLPFTALGAISPLVAKLALADGGPAGRRIGSVFAWSIAGSLLGVFVTGYFLLAYAGNRAILGCSALVLAAIGTALLLRARKSDTAPIESAPGSGAAPRLPLRPIIVVFLAGALVMMVELAGARMLSRIYGSSLFTWTNTIGTILAAMALGGRLGGRWADRIGGQPAAAAALVAAAAATAAAPLIHTILYRMPVLWDLSWPLQILLHTILVFFLPCLFLGAVPPAIVRHAVDNNPAAGRAVGALYAWNSVGSVLGALLTGYVLIAALGTVEVICVVFLATAALALYTAPASLSARAGCVVAVALGLAAFVPMPPFSTVGLNLGLRPYRAPSTVYERESQYSYIAVNEVDPEGQPGVRNFVLDKMVHNKADIHAPAELKYPYLVFYAAALDAAFGPSTPLSTLSIGGGGYSFINYLETARPGGHTEAVEIDPAVTEAAHAAFGFPRDTRAIVHHMDGRNFLATAERGQTGRNIDAILGDCFSDYAVPFHLVTQEYIEHIDSLLADDGVYLLNMIDLYEIGDFLAAVIGTTLVHFPHVQVFATEGLLDRRETFVIVASHRAIDLQAAVDAANTKSGLAGRLLTDNEIASLRARARVDVLTDDFAPVENLLAPVVLRTEESVLFRRLIRADNFLEQGRPDRAARECEKILARTDNIPEAAELLAAAYEAMGNAAGAVAVFEGLAARRPDNVVYAERLARALFRAKRPQEAVTTWRRVLELSPGNVDTQLNLGGALVQLGRLDEAAPHVEAAAKALPNNISAQVNLASLYLGREDYPNAMRVLAETALRHPKSPELQVQLAIVAYRGKDYAAAWRAIGRARELGAQVPPALVRDLERDSGRSQ